MLTTSATQSSLPSATRRARRTATVLVATDGKPQSDGAIRVALARAHEMGATVSILSVAMPQQPMAPPELSLDLWAEAMRASRESLRDAAEKQVAELAGDARALPVALLDGHPARTIARIAEEQWAALVVVGLGRHNVADRLFGDETALQLARICRVPVLAVPAAALAVPRHALAAIDFSPLSISAAQAAIDAMGNLGRVELVHVMPHLHEDAFAIEAEEPYARWVAEQLAAAAQELVAPHGVRISTAAIRGRPAPAMLEYAAKSGADLIATGTHGRGFVARTVLGSVTSQLIRAATCSILTVPRDPLPVGMGSLRAPSGI